MMELYQSYIVNANEPDMEDFDEEWDDEDEEWDEDSSDEENEEMDLSDNDKPIDPRWSALNKLK
jgi:hypothetical protein